VVNPAMFHVTVQVETGKEMTANATPVVKLVILAEIVLRVEIINKMEMLVVRTMNIHATLVW